MGARTRAGRFPTRLPRVPAALPAARTGRSARRIEASRSRCSEERRGSSGTGGETWRGNSATWVRLESASPTNASRAATSSSDRRSSWDCRSSISTGPASRAPKSESRRSQERVAALAVEIRSEAREASDAWLAASTRWCSHYRDGHAAVAADHRQRDPEVLQRHAGRRVRPAAGAGRPRCRRLVSTSRPSKEFWLAWTDLERAVGASVRSPHRDQRQTPAISPDAITPTRRAATMITRRQILKTGAAHVGRRRSVASREPLRR